MRATAKLAPDAVVADDITLTELINRNGRSNGICRCA
jgi:hypothetical protein